MKTWGMTGIKSDLEAQLVMYADRVRHLGEIIQIYLEFEQVTLISERVPKLGIRVAFSLIVLRI